MTYGPILHSFDTSSVRSVTAQVAAVNPKAVILLRSMVPVGFTAAQALAPGGKQVVFAPEFLREGMAFPDFPYPGRIVIGERSASARRIAALLLKGALRNDIDALLTDPSEAEAIKVFSNTYLPIRVAFFDELDSYVLARDLDSRQIIRGVCLDLRLGAQYNNPGFGYGGDCLAKDCKPLLANYGQVPQNLIAAIVDTNRIRKDFLAERIIATAPGTVGLYRLVTRAGSDNFRQSAVEGIMKRIKATGIVHETELGEARFFGSKVQRDLQSFKAECDLILANRHSTERDDVRAKVFTRDLFGAD